MAELEDVLANAGDVVSTEEDARILTRELRRYLGLVAAFPHEKLSPSPDVDAAWHALMLLPSHYWKVCAELRTLWARPGDAPLSGAAVTLPHDPRRAGDSDAVRRARYERTLALYAAVHAEAAAESVWPRDYAVPPHAAGGGCGGDEGGDLPLPPAGDMRVLVKTMTGEILTFNAVAPSWRVEHLKQLLRSATGAPRYQQRLIFAAKQLEDESTLAEAGVGKGAMVNLILRLGGC